MARNDVVNSDGSLNIDRLGQNVDDINDHTSQLAETETQLINKDSEFSIALADKISNFTKEEVVKPTGFNWDGEPINVYKMFNKIETNFNITAYEHVGAGKTYYVDKVNGNDSNDGLTSGTALKTIDAARSKSDVDIIIVASGYYIHSEGFNNKSTLSKNITIKAASGADVTLSTRAPVTWTKASGYTNVYQTSRTYTASVYDELVLDEYGDFTKYQAVSSIADVDATPGSYYFVSPDLYIHTPGSRAADDNVVVFLDVYNFYNVGNYRTYFEGIKFHGGKSGCVHIGVTATSNTTLIAAKNCEFKYSTEGYGGANIEGADAIFENCLAAKNYKDGFNYHYLLDRVNRAIEINCVSRHNGLGRGVLTDNGSTMHNGGKIIRINGRYYENEGPNVHDIHLNTQSWNINCEAYNSQATNPLRTANYRIETTGKMWLDSCYGHDSEQPLFVGSDCEMHIRNCKFPDGADTNDIKGVLSLY
jgi:hypothetical protein